MHKTPTELEVTGLTTLVVEVPVRDCCLAVSPGCIDSMLNGECTFKGLLRLA